MPNAIAQFRDLHASGCFVIPNPWDIGSAKYLHHLGFKALATTSAGFAFSRGMPDDSSVVPVEAVLEHAREIVEATPLPVNCDFQNGYADDPEQVAENVTRCVATGVAGLSIEDSTRNRSTPLYDFEFAVERIKAARQAIDASGSAVVLTGRCEVFLVRDPNAFDISMKRVTAYADAGADCLFAPGVSNPDHIAAIVKAVSPKPVNVLVHKSDPNLTFAKLADLGVRRISVGSALARAAWRAFAAAAEEIQTSGTFDAFGEGAAVPDLNTIFRQAK
jgi:2-methylisocitrate lyase-like PEP mutase family enzyme